MRRGQVPTLCANPHEQICSLASAGEVGFNPTVLVLVLESDYKQCGQRCIACLHAYHLCIAEAPVRVLLEGQHHSAEHVLH